MTKKKSTKRALISSLLILAMCFTMLAGTTFAWFTDTVESTGNIIKSGTLRVSMKWADAKEDPANATWTDASAGPIFNYQLWEPGYVDAKHIAIANDGSLALKYQVQIVANGPVSVLADVIDVYFVDPAIQVADRAALDNIQPVGTLKEVLAGGMDTTGHLLAGKDVALTIALKMRETAGNEYQDKSIGTDFSVKLLATQYTYESDSFNDQYDLGAELPAASVNEFQAALASGDPVVLANDINNGTGFTTSTSGNKNVTVDLNNKTYNVESNPVGSTGTESQGFQLLKGTTNSFENGTLSSTSGSGVQFLIQNYSDLTLNNVTLDGSGLDGMKYVLSNNCGNVTIKGDTDFIVPAGGVAFDLWYGMSDVYLDGITVTFDESFTGTVGGDIEYGVHANGLAKNPDWTEKTVLIIKGNGTFEGQFKSGSPSRSDIADANIQIYSGKFKYDPSQFVVATSTVEYVNGYYVVTAA